MSKIETPYIELECASEAPSVIHLNIGMKGVLHTYHLEQPKKAPKPRAVIPKIKLPVGDAAGPGTVTTTTGKGPAPKKRGPKRKTTTELKNIQFSK